MHIFLRIGCIGTPLYTNPLMMPGRGCHMYEGDHKWQMITYYCIIHIQPIVQNMDYNKFNLFIA